MNRLFKSLIASFALVAGLALPVIALAFQAKDAPSKTAKAVATSAHLPSKDIADAKAKGFVWGQHEQQNVSARTVNSTVRPRRASL